MSFPIRSVASPWLPFQVFIIVVASLSSVQIAQGQDGENEAKQRTEGTSNEIACELPEIREEILKRVKKDQDARFQFIEVLNSKLPDDAEERAKAEAHRTTLIATMTAVDTENREWLKKVIAKEGWLGASKVGREGAHGAWLLVQHADRDLEFQKECLELMKALPEEEVAKVDIAYLTDRVLCAENKPQLYGTQVVVNDGKAELKEVADREQLDERRASVGLEPIEDYLKRVEEAMGGKQ